MTAPINPLSLKLQQYQRQRAIADAMQQDALTPLQAQTSGTGSYPVVVAPSPFQVVAKLGQAYASSRMNSDLDKRYSDIADEMTRAQTQAISGIAAAPQNSGYPGVATTPSSDRPSMIRPPDQRWRDMKAANDQANSQGAMPGQGQPQMPTASMPNLPPQLITNPGYQPSPAAPTTPPPAPAGAGPAVSPSSPGLQQQLEAYQNALMYGVDPEVIKIAAAARAPTPEMKNIAAVYGENSPQYQTALERTVNPAVATNANSPLARFNPQTGQYETAYAPPNIEKGTVPIVQNGQITGVRGLPGANETAAAHEAAITAATEAQKGHWQDDPLHPGTGKFIFPTPPAYGGGINDLGAIGRPPGAMPSAPPVAPNAADLEGQKVGAKTGQDYAASLNDSANAAVQGKRTLAEMQNLLQGFNPGAGTPVLSKMGAAAEALGVDPATVQSVLGGNTGDQQAFQKGTAALAGEAAKQVTNRVTQTEFKVFLANNPNWMMTPGGIKRVMDFMGKGFDNQIEQQQQFSKWSRTTSPDRWAIDFPAAYNQQQLARINAGQTNSAPASLTGIRTAKDTATAAQAQGGPVQWQKGMTIDQARKQYKPGTVFTFPDGSHGSL